MNRARFIRPSFKKAGLQILAEENLSGRSPPALRRDDIRCLAVGCEADVAIADRAHLAMRPRHDPLRSLVYSASERAVLHVFVDGEQVVRDQKVLTIDYEAASAALEELNSAGSPESGSLIGPGGTPMRSQVLRFHGDSDASGARAARSIGLNAGS